MGARLRSPTGGGAAFDTRSSARVACGTMDPKTQSLAVAISGSPSPASKSTRLAELALRRLADEGARTRRVSLADLSAADLLGRDSGPDLAAALEAVGEADIVVASTPVYRATYSGLLKVFFDLLPRNALAGRVGLALATGADPGHATVIDDLARLFDSVGAHVVRGPYGLDADFEDGRPSDALARHVHRAALAALGAVGRHPPASPSDGPGDPAAAARRNPVEDQRAARPARRGGAKLRE